MNIPRVIVVTLLVGLPVSSIVSSCKKEETPPPPEQTSAEEQEHHEEGVVELSPGALKEAGIELQTAQGGELEQVLTLPGEIALNADRVVHIVPRVGGIVRRVNKTLGDEVNVPATSWRLSKAASLAEAKAAYLAAKQRLALAKVTLDSAEGLRAKSILPGLEYLGIKRDFNNAEIELRTAEQKLHALGLTPRRLPHTQPAKEGVVFAVRTARSVCRERSLKNT